MGFDRRHGWFVRDEDTGNYMTDLHTDEYRDDGKKKRPGARHRMRQLARRLNKAA